MALTVADDQLQCFQRGKDVTRHHSYQNTGIKKRKHMHNKKPNLQEVSIIMVSCNIKMFIPEYRILWNRFQN